VQWPAECTSRQEPKSTGGDVQEGLSGRGGRCGSRATHPDPGQSASVFAHRLGVLTLVRAGWAGSFRAGTTSVMAITDTARRASEQHLGERLALAGPQDELKELADTLTPCSIVSIWIHDPAKLCGQRFPRAAYPLTIMRTALEVTLAKPATRRSRFALCPPRSGGRSIRLRRPLTRC